MTNSKIQAAILALLISTTLATITQLNGLPSGPVLPEDTIVFEMSRVFNLALANLSKLSFTVSQSTNASLAEGAVDPHIYDYHTPYFTQDLSNVTAINFAKFVDETAYAFVQNASTFVYHETTANRGSLKNSWNVDLGHFGTDILCQDVALSNTLKDLYVACGGRTATPGPGKNYLFVSLVDRSLRSESGKHNFTLDSKFKITNEVRVQPFYVKKGDVEHLLVYNQGRTHAKKQRENQYFMVLQRHGSELVRADTDIPEYELVTLNNATDFTAVYDIWPFDNEHLLVSGRRQGSENTTTLTLCKWSVSNGTATCPDAISWFSLDDGKFDISSRTGLVTIVDYRAKQVTINTLNGYNASSPDWFNQVNQMNITDMPDLTNNWVRSIDGDQDAMVIKWTSTTNLDSFLTWISWELGLEESYKDLSGTVLGLNAVILNKEQLSYTRIGYPFAMYKGSEISTNPDNKLIVTAKEGTVKTNATGNIYRIDTQTVPVGFKYTAPYTDAFPDSFFQVPFSSNNIYQGNNVRFRLEYESEQYSGAFGPSQIVNDFTPEIVLDEAEPKHGWQKVAVTSGWFIGQDRGGLISIYSCQWPSMHSKGCTRQRTQKTKENEILQTEIYSKGEAVMFWSSNGHDGYANIWTCTIEDGCHNQLIEYVPTSVAFYEDDHRDHFLVAIAQFDSEGGENSNGFVHLFYTDNQFHDQWTELATIDGEWLSLSAFCPYKVYPDPGHSRIHILSSCKSFLAFGANLIVAFDTTVPMKPKVPITTVPLAGTSGFPDFCPMEDHYIIADMYGAGPRYLWAVDQAQTTSVYNKHFENYGVNSLQKFQCMPFKQLYSIFGQHGNKNVTHNYIYALFSGESMLNVGRYIRRINADLDYQHWNNIDTYALDHAVLWVGYPNHDGFDKVNYGAQLNKAPVMWTKVAHIDPGFNDTDVTFKVIASSNGEEYTAQGQLTLKDVNTSVFFEVQKYWDAKPGQVNLEDLTQIWGPISGVKMIGSSPGWLFLDRKRNHGGMSLDDNQFVFDQFRGSYQQGVGIVTSNALTTFVLISDHKWVSTKAIKGILTFDTQPIVQLGGPRSLVFYIGQSSSGNYLSALSFGIGKKGQIQSSSAVRLPADKVRLCPTGEGPTNNLIGFALNTEKNEAYVLDVTQSTKDISIKHIQTIQGVWDIDCTVPKTDNVGLFYIGVEDTTINMANFQWQGNTKSWKNTFNHSAVPNSDTPYWLTSIASSSSNGVSHIAVTTMGTVTFVVDIDYESKNQTLVNTLQNYQDFIAESTFLNDNWLVQRAVGVNTGETNILIYKTRSKDNTLHTAINTNRWVPPGPAPSDDDLAQSKSDHDPTLPRGVPFTFFMQQDQQGNSFPVVAVGTRSTAHPMVYYKIADMQLSVPQDYDADVLSNLKFVFEGQVDTPVKVEDFLNGDVPTPTPKPDRPTLKVWPFIVIICLLVLAAVGWFVYARAKGQPEEGEAEYFSMQPESKVTDAEAKEEGLEDDDGFDQEDEGLN